MAVKIYYEKDCDIHALTAKRSLLSVTALRVMLMH